MLRPDSHHGPTQTLHPAMNAARAAELNQFGFDRAFDRATAIITGREPASALDAALQDWRGRGGDQIRKEFEQALKEQ